MYCPNCGKEQYDEDAPDCYNCGQSWDPLELEKLIFKFCANCGIAVSQKAEVCNKCGSPLKVSLEEFCESDQYIIEAEKLVQAGKYLEAIPYLKKAITATDDHAPKKDFSKCGAIFSCYMQVFLQRYGDDLEDWNRSELKNSSEFKDALYYAERALTALRKCDPALQRQVKRDPQSGIKGMELFIDMMRSSDNDMEAPKSMAKVKSSSGCFVATAVYGSSQAPEVKMLRQFRDKVLLQSNTGRVFVNAYYYFSPPLARLISKSEILKMLARSLLLKPLTKLLDSKEDV